MEFEGKTAVITGASWCLARRTTAGTGASTIESAQFASRKHLWYHGREIVEDVIPWIRFLPT